MKQLPCRGDGNQAHVRSAVGTMREDDSFTVTAVLTLPGWHINANPASLDFLIPLLLMCARTPARRK